MSEYEDRACYRCGREVEANSDAARCHDCTVTLLRAALEASQVDLAASRKQSADLATALWKCETERDELVDELRVRGEDA